MKSLKVGPALLTGVCMLIGMAFGLSGALAAGHVSDVGSPSDGQHAAVHRPVSDFVSAQGSTNGFIPPIPDFIAWTDNPPNGCNATKFASVDYAGVAAAWLQANGGPAFGTQVGGSVTERPLADGRADVTVVLNTSNAISWVVAFPINDLATDPTIFGSRANEILANPSLQPGLSTCVLQVEFTNTAMGAPLPDLVNAFILGNGLPGQSLTTLSFRSSGSGPLHAAFGVPEGTPGTLTVSQTGLLTHTFQGCPGDAFPAEVVRVVANGGSSAALGSAPLDGMRQNGGVPAVPAPALRHTWGELKLLYR